jgi:hypothetical protein
MPDDLKQVDALLVTKDDQYGIFATTNNLMVIGLDSENFNNSYSIDTGRFLRLIFSKNEDFIFTSLWDCAEIRLYNWK